MADRRGDLKHLSIHQRMPTADIQKDRDPTEAMRGLLPSLTHDTGEKNVNITEVINSFVHRSRSSQFQAAKRKEMEGLGERELFATL